MKKHIDICVLLGDQLSHEVATLQQADKNNSIILMAELFDEAHYVKHHKKKLVFILSAMRHFAEELKQAGWNVRYIKLDDPYNTHSFTGEVQRSIADLSTEFEIDTIAVTEAGEYRVQEQISQWHQLTGIPVICHTDTRFFATTDYFARWAEGRKQLRMEYFYRQMRADHQILMDGKDPEGGQWNYDHDNRQSPDKNIPIPAPFSVEADTITTDVKQLVEKHFPAHFGDIEPFYLAVNGEQAEQVLDHFITERLANFGRFQDAMLQDEPFMFHAHIGFYLNCGLLSPKQAVLRVEQAYYAGHAPLNAVEGFIRQILGWREYVRGLYWYKMPEYKSMNALQAERKLPSFFWTGKTQMNCLSQSIGQTKKYAYAHHIQRLMVIGNFALLAGLHPDEVNEWFLIVYADAYEWVELPNVSGMVLYADDGIMASKPYAAGGSYIDRMSDYCASCSYKVKIKTGETACPFNYLYWDFLARNQEKLANNPRMGMMYRTYAKMKDENKEKISHSASAFLSSLDKG